MKLIDDVLDDYILTVQNSVFAPGTPNTPSLKSIFELLPKFLEDLLSANSRETNDYRCYGSYGQANRSFPKIPWVLCTRRDISTSAGKGYYIVLLFHEKMDGFWMSLNQGVTFYQELFGSRLIARKQAKTAARVLSNVVTDSHGFNQGQIDLGATLDLGKDYEAAAIFSKFYPSNSDNLEATLTSDFGKMLEIYDGLANQVGTDIVRFLPEDESAYQLAASELSKSKKTEKAEGDLRPKPPRRGNGASSEGGWLRDPKIAARALENARNECENCGVPTFFRKNSTCNFVEAHHLIPMAAQGEFGEISLDVGENIVALCPNCHRKIHHGRASDYGKMIEKFHIKRMRQLEKHGLPIELDVLVKLYDR